jgi:hypothetical protein
MINSLRLNSAIPKRKIVHVYCGTEVNIKRISDTSAYNTFSNLSDIYRTPNISETQICGISASPLMHTISHGLQSAETLRRHCSTLPASTERVYFYWPIMSRFWSRKPRIRP